MFVSGLLHSQSFPYLNASTGNTGAPAVDKDTNVILFHYNVIEKLDKNYNSVWKKSYDGLNFHSLLLSKTGSSYFISSNSIGKIDFNGNLIWCKQIDSTKNSSIMSPLSGIYPQQLFLDRNNNLMISGVSFIMKMDTNGNVLKYKCITYNFGLKEYKVINDSSGIYTIIGSGNVYDICFISRNYFSDALDSIVLTEYHDINPALQTAEKIKIFKSKHDPNVYYVVFAYAPVGVIMRNLIILKNFKNIGLWSRTFTYNASQDYNWENLDEDKHKNIFLSLSTGPNYSVIPGKMKWTKFALKIDSIGTLPFQKINFINEYHTSNFAYFGISSALVCVKPNSYLYYVDGASYAYSPTFVALNNALSTTCTAPETFTANLGGNYNMGWSTPFVRSFNPFSYAIHSQTIPVTVLPSAFFHDNCKTVSIQEYEKLSVSLYPNPTNNIITIITDDEIKSLTIYNALGVKVNFVQMNANTIDISSFARGLYYLSITNSKGIVTRKIIKE